MKRLLMVALVMTACGGTSELDRCEQDCPGASRVNVDNTGEKHGCQCFCANRDGTPIGNVAFTYDNSTPEQWYKDFWLNYRNNNCHD